eukprot:816555-Pelagomonas_calceolata.AAC.1
MTHCLCVDPCGGKNIKEGGTSSSSCGIKEVLKVRSLPMLLPEGSSFDESTSQEACMSSTTSTDSRVSGTTSTDSRVSKTSSTSSSVPESGSTVDSGVPEGCGGHGAGGSSNSNGCGGGKSDGAGGAGDGGVRDEKQEGAIKGGESGAGGQCGVPAPLIQGPVLLAGLRGYLIMSSPRYVVRVHKHIHKMGSPLITVLARAKS